MKRALASILPMLLLACVVWAAEEHAAGAETSHLDLWKLANLVLFAGVLGYALWKKAGGFFRSRSEQIRTGIAEAARLKQDAEVRYAAVERRLANLGADIERLRARAREEAAAEQARVREEMERDLKKIQAEAKREIAAAAQAARQELRAHSAELAVGLAAAKIRRRLTPEIQDTLVSSVVGDLERQAAGRPQAGVF